MNVGHIISRKDYFKFLAKVDVSIKERFKTCGSDQAFVAVRIIATKQTGRDTRPGTVTTKQTGRDTRPGTVTTVLD